MPMAKLVKLDSLLKESQRLNLPSQLELNREIRTKSMVYSPKRRTPQTRRPYCYGCEPDGT